MVQPLKVQTLGGELLVGALDAVGAAGEGDVRDLAAAAVLGEHARLGRAGDELDVLRASGLSNLEVQAGNLLERVRVCNVDADVAELAVEVGRVYVVLLVQTVDARPATCVLVSRQDSGTDEAGGCLEKRTVDGIANGLRTEEDRDGCRNRICSRREVHNGVFGGRPVALLTTPVALALGLAWAYGRNGECRHRHPFRRTQSCEGRRAPIAFASTCRPMFAARQRQWPRPRWRE